MGTLFGAGAVESRQVLGIVAEVGIHFEDILITSLQCPLKAGYIGCSQSQLSFALHHEEAFRKLLLQGLYNGSRSVGRTVFNDKDVKTMFQSKNGTDDIFYILPFIVGGDDDNAV